MVDKNLKSPAWKLRRTCPGGCIEVLIEHRQSLGITPVAPA